MWLIKPTKIFGLGLNGFYVAAKYDRTFWQHLVFGFFIGIIQGFSLVPFLTLLALSSLLTKEVVDGWAYEECIGEDKCKQGFDLLDFSSGIIGMTLGVILITFIRGF